MSNPIFKIPYRLGDELNQRTFSAFQNDTVEILFDVKSEDDCTPVTPDVADVILFELYDRQSNLISFATVTGSFSLPFSVISIYPSSYIYVASLNGNVISTGNFFVIKK